MEIDTKNTIQHHTECGRYIVGIGSKFSIEDRTITFDRKDLQESINSMLAWANKPPRKTGKFYIDGSSSTKKQRALLELHLDGRFVLVI